MNAFAIAACTVSLLASGVMLGAVEIEAVDAFIRLASVLSR